MRKFQLSHALVAVIAILTSTSEGTTPCQAQNLDGCSSSGLNAGLYADVDLIFTKPHVKESFESTRLEPLTGSLTLQPFSYDYSVSPKTTLGYRNPGGIGFRATHWMYDNSSNLRSEAATLTSFPGVSSVSVIFPAAISTTQPGDLLTTQASMQFQTVDLEGTLDVFLPEIQMTISGGLRFASMQQIFHGDVTRAAVPIQTLDWSREFDAAGLTFGVDGKHQLREINGFEVFLLGDLQGSLVYGDKTLKRNVVGDVTPPPNMTAPNLILDNLSEASGIFEIALGFEVARDLERAGRIFTRGQYHGQLWTAAGAPTLSFLGFEGFSVGLGWER